MSESGNMEVRVVSSKELHESAGSIFSELLRGRVTYVIARYGVPAFELTTLSAATKVLLAESGDDKGKRSRKVSSNKEDAHV